MSADIKGLKMWLGGFGIRRIRQLELAIRCAKNEIDAVDGDEDLAIAILSDAIPFNDWGGDKIRAVVCEELTRICEEVPCIGTGCVEYYRVGGGEPETFGFPPEADPLEGWELDVPWPSGGTVDYCPSCAKRRAEPVE